MADIFSSHVGTSSVGMDYRQWFKTYFLNTTDFKKGHQIECIDISGNKIKKQLNACAVLFDKCKFVRIGKKLNHSDGGSNAVEGQPFQIVDIESVYLPFFVNTKTGILENLENFFIVPMTFLHISPSMKIFMDDSCASFVSQKKGNNIHCDTHIANALCCALTSIINSISNMFIDILNTSENINNETMDKIKLFVFIYCNLLKTTKSASLYSQKINNILKLLPYVSNIEDTYQSVVMSQMLDETPHVSIKVKNIALSLINFFKNQTNKLIVHDTTLVGLFFVIPTILNNFDVCSDDLFQNCNYDNDKKTAETIAEQLKSIFLNIKEEINLNHPDNLDNHSMNTYIFKKYVTDINPSNSSLLISSDIFEKTYQTIFYENDIKNKNIANTLELSKIAPFVDLDATHNLTLNGSSVTNHPILIKTNFDNPSSLNTTWISANIKDWTGLSLYNNNTYNIECKPLGNAQFTHGNTLGTGNVSNFRITCGNEILGGKYSGFASTGMMYDPKTKKYSLCKPDKAIDVSKPIQILSNSNEILISQLDKILFKIPKDKQNQNILFCFKYCSVTIITSPMCNTSQTISVNTTKNTSNKIIINKKKYNKPEKYTKKPEYKISAENNWLVSLICDKERKKVRAYNNIKEKKT